MTDIPRLMKVIDYIESIPNATEWHWDITGNPIDHEKDNGWYQPTWLATKGQLTITESGVVDQTGQHCGTAACLAGHTVFMFGENGTKVCGSSVTLPNGKVTGIREYAMWLLDLSLLDANTLFDASNSLNRIRQTAEYIARREEALGD